MITNIPETVRIPGLEIELGVTAVTFEQYDEFASAAGHRVPRNFGWGRGDRPVIDVSQQDAIAYCEWLSEKTGELYCLPTPSEWEVACRAGTTTAYNTGKTITKEQANFSADQTVPVKSYAPNAWGLYDTHGNVWEHTIDMNDETKTIIRGGSWFSSPENLRSAIRFWFSTDIRCNTLGFRVVKH